MDEILKDLCIKLDKIIQQQEIILSKLDNKLILENTKTDFPKKVSLKKKKGFDENDPLYISIKEMFELRPYKKRFQEKFNLLTPPHINRVKEYLRTGDSSVFDGLRRNE